MNELEKYIRAHAAEFDTEAPAWGHEERFLARLDVTPGAVVERPVIRRLRPANLLALAFAACVAALLLIRPGDPLHGLSRDPEAIYLAYMDQVADLYRDMPLQDDALRAITEEEEPLFDQMPEDMSPRQRSRILKAHYGELLAAARQLKKIQ
jgi:hypothetical protein